jgi:hypothetical protein
LYDA